MFFILGLVWSSSGAHAQAVTSEEVAPLVCQRDEFVGGVKCLGRYCDHMMLRCVAHDGLRWTGKLEFQPYVSDGSQSPARCAADAAMIGLKCKGRYCDDISIMCVQYKGLDLGGKPKLSDSVSEENGGTLDLEDGVIAVGLQCSGRYCDNVALLGVRLPRRVEESPSPKELFPRAPVPGDGQRPDDPPPGRF